MQVCECWLCLDFTQAVGISTAAVSAIVFLGKGWLEERKLRADEAAQRAAKLEAQAAAIPELLEKQRQELLRSFHSEAQRKSDNGNN